MENSPLRFLDNDVSKMLCEQVRNTQETNARQFHDNLFHYGEKVNGDHHSMIVNVYKNEPIDFDFSNVKYMNDILSNKKIFNNTCNLIKYYYEQHIENTRLQRTTNKL